MKLLIYSLDSYSVLKPGTGILFGGAEIETGYFARGLAERGLDVTVITHDHAKGIERQGRLTIFPHPVHKGKGFWEWRQSLRGKILFKLRKNNKYETGINETYDLLRPDAGYVMGISRGAFELYKWCQSHKTCFILRVAHDKELLPDLDLETTCEKWSGLKVYEIEELFRSADLVLTQTQGQDDLLLKRFGVKGVQMVPPIKLLPVQKKKEERKFDLFWVGRNFSFKRPEKFIELAKQNPGLKCCMVLNNLEDKSWNELRNSVPSNVTFFESVDVDQINGLFADSRIFISTSLREGFANTFLQSANSGTPVISMGSDPNGMLTVHGAGFNCGDDLNKVQEKINQLLSSSGLYDVVSNAAKKYVSTYHDNEKLTDVLKDRILQLLQNPKAHLE